MKLETMACGVTWVLMNSLLVMLAVELLPGINQQPVAPISQYQSKA